MRKASRDRKSVRLKWTFLSASKKNLMLGKGCEPDLRPGKLQVLSMNQGQLSIRNRFRADMTS